LDTCFTISDPTTYVNLLKLLREYLRELWCYPVYASSYDLIMGNLEEVFWDLTQNQEDP
jgi:hypothetical protein